MNADQRVLQGLSDISTYEKYYYMWDDLWNKELWA